jgi:hypothetical protein
MAALTMGPAPIAALSGVIPGVVLLASEWWGARPTGGGGVVASAQNLLVTRHHRQSGASRSRPARVRSIGTPTRAAPEVSDIADTFESRS